MMKLSGRAWTSLVACALAACGGGGGAPAPGGGSGSTRGTLVEDPPALTATLTAATLTTALQATTEGQALLLVTGSPDCGLDVHALQYRTVGGNGEQTTASGVLMLPTGAAPPCIGPRPIFLYAHGTDVDIGYDLAALPDQNNAANTEATLLAAMFAARGFVVVAPNYAGYNGSPLPYHPYLNADQQSKDMIDALAAARTAIGHIASAVTSDNGQLFVSGYSQGGHVAMATVRALQEAGATVTASVPMSGPYALEAFGDAILFGSVNLGATVFLPLITASYQHAYGDLYAATTDFYEAAYATGIETLLPSSNTVGELFTQGKLPQTALFSSATPVTGNPPLDAALAVPNDPLFALGFGPNNLVLNDVRVAYAQDALANPDGAVPTPQPGVPVAAAATHPFRRALKANDLRNPAWTPNAPMLLCGGRDDPTVFYPVNTETMQAFWAALPPGLVTVLDVDSALTGISDPFANVKLGFAATKAATAAAAGGGAAGDQAVIEAYHGGLVAPFCARAAREFISTF